MIRRRGRLDWVISVACVCIRIYACICGNGEVRRGVGTVGSRRRQ